MRILISSNAPWVQTGYGVQTAIAMHYLRQLGHDVAVLAFWGLEGSVIDMGEVPIYPNDPRDYGLIRAKMYYDHFGADIFMTHIDVWVLQGLDPTINWVPRFPIDHEPTPPLVIQTLRKHPGLILPIAESRFGQRLLKEEGIEAAYIPPAVDCETFKPDPDASKLYREKYKWQDKFIIGMVGTNHDERKNWTVAMKAVKVLHDRHPGKIIFYMHTNTLDPRGINLEALRAALGMEKYTFKPAPAQMATGIERETLARAYNAMDVFLLPSKGEGVGVPLIEAQACGVPIITTKCTGQQEVMGGGWFIEQLDPVWTLQHSWQFMARTEEVLEKLELAYKAWEDGSIKVEKEKARKKALEYDERKLFKETWPPVLDEIEKRLKQPRNAEGIQTWRLAFIPKTCTPRKVLDVGCGITQPYRVALEHLGEYIGVDIREGENITVADAAKLPFGDGEFGFVWVSEVLEHVKNPKKVLAEAKRVGKHGVCLFSTPMNRYFKGDPDHKVVKLPYTTIATGDGLIAW